MKLSLCSGFVEVVTRFSMFDVVTSLFLNARSVAGKPELLCYVSIKKDNLGELWTSWHT